MDRPQADSIVYIDGGNVWSASPDGARKVQLTDGGGWHSPTQADDGTIAPRPVELSFSPDGTRLACAYVASSCPVASSCGTIQRSTFYTDAGVTEATPVAVYGNQFGVSDPEWVTNARTVGFGGYGSQVSNGPLHDAEQRHVLDDGAVHDAHPDGLIARLGPRRPARAPLRRPGAEPLSRVRAPATIRPAARR